MTGVLIAPMPRKRSTKAEIAELQDAIVAAVEADAPVTLRGVYYRCVSAGAVAKTENGYKQIGRELLKLRRQGRVSYDDITDGTRWITKPTTYDSLDDFLDDAGRSYRRALWTHADTLVQIFTEKDAISGVVEPVTARWDVPLGVLRGYVSETFAWQVGRSLDPRYRHVIAQLGDHDPSGVGAWHDFANKVLAFTTAADVEFIRLAVTPEQIVLMDLPTRPTKQSDTRARNWEGGSVEVDAIPAATLRQLLNNFISGHVDSHQLDVLLAAEDDERQILQRLDWRSA